MQYTHSLRDDLKKKSKKQDIVPLSVDPYPPTIKREVLIRDNFDFFLPPTHLIEKGTFLKKEFSSHDFVLIPTYLLGQIPVFYSFFFWRSSLIKTSLFMVGG